MRYIIQFNLSCRTCFGILKQRMPHIYIMMNMSNTTIYIGVTNNLGRRIHEHKKGVIKGFTQKYKLTKIVYIEEYKDISEAIGREKQLKNWHRNWKLNLISKVNPSFKDLSDPETSSG